MKKNCWEFKSCERQAGGKLIGKMGICPASADKSLNGVHGGYNAGRACWVVAGTFCGGVVQGTEAQKEKNCWLCDFFQLVRKEESITDVGFSITRLGMIRVMQKMVKS